jgi:hypothetical protein
MATSNPVVNGSYYSFANVELRVGGLFFKGIKSINYGFKVGSQFVRGTAILPLGITLGQAEPRCDFEMFLPQFNFLVTQLGPGFMQRKLDLTSTYGNVLDNGELPTITDSIQGATIIEVGADNGESLDASVRKFTLMPLRMLFNGVPPVLQSNVGAVG